jgi:hypothetical protein
MTVFQKAAILVVRFYTFVMFVYGIIGLAECGYLQGTGHPDPYIRERVVAGVVWIAVGGVGMLISQPLGKWLGRGLG